MTESPPPPFADDLTLREQALVDAAQRGQEWVCNDADLETVAATKDLDYVVRAEVIRTLLLGEQGRVDPRSVRLRKARIIGALDLNHVVM